ncbi:hypothetical protein ACM26V_05125 [Salipaludibacillus sp. HK11]|uniref:hypothetical protein n=1 Tax=Salipaludibacillus sp. HK11 TaxID=3394320 RepID=UPI0039FD6FEF
MADSKAKKLRNKLVREGRRNPVRDRSPFSHVDMGTKVTKTKKDYIYQTKYKKASFHDSNGNEAFLYYPIINIRNSLNPLTFFQTTDVFH